VSLYEFADILNVSKRLLQIFIAMALYCVEGLYHFGIHDEFANFVDFGSGSKLVI
jgi:hypothetical protein